METAYLSQGVEVEKVSARSSHTNTLQHLLRFPFLAGGGTLPGVFPFGHSG